MGEWKEYKLSDFAEILDFKRIPLSSTERNKRKGEYPYYGASGIIDYINDYIFDGEYVLISEDGENLRSRQTPIAFITSGKFWVNNHAHIVKADTIHNRLICYYFANLDLNPFITGAVQPKLSQASLCNIPLYLPKEKKDRVNIVKFLSSLDDKIDLLNRQNATLEKMAETLFRQWFIENELGNNREIILGEVVETTSGGTPSRANLNFYQNGTVCWVKSKELNGGYILESEEKITNQALNESSAKIIPENSILIAMYGATVGEYAILSKDMACNQAVCALIPNHDYPYTYLYAWTKSMKEDFLNLACGAAQQNISQVVVKQQLVSNNIELIAKYDKVMKPYFEIMKTNQKQISTLTQLRDILLPKLINGEITVR